MISLSLYDLMLSGLGILILALQMLKFKILDNGNQLPEALGEKKSQYTEQMEANFIPSSRIQRNHSGCLSQTS
jgi:hypothetical protein